MGFYSRDDFSWTDGGPPLPKKNEKDKANLIAGMFVEAQIITEDQLSTSLPETAIITEEEAHFVLVELPKNGTDYQFAKRAVTVGQRQNGVVQILNGQDFSEKERILTKGGFNLLGIE